MSPRVLSVSSTCILCTNRYVLRTLRHHDYQKEYEGLECHMQSLVMVGVNFGYL